MNDLCVQPHDTDRRALPSLRLCAACHDRLRRDLQALPRLHAGLDAALAAGHSPRYGHRVSGSSSAPLPINIAVADLRDQIRHDLAWWTRFVAERRGITALPAPEVAGMAAWLLTHADWIAAHEEAAVDCPPVVRELARRARGLLDPSGAKRIEIGPCPETGCGGTLYATVRRDDDPRPSVIYCPTCGLEKGAAEWRRFGREYLRERRMAG